MERVFITMAGLLGAIGVGLGAFGAHGLRDRLAALEDGSKRMEWWQTAAHYHLVHALAIGLAAWLVTRGTGLPARAAGYCFAGGIVLFSGSLYAMTLGAPRWFGAITPFGGLLMMAGWACVALAAARP